MQGNLPHLPGTLIGRLRRPFMPRPVEGSYSANLFVLQNHLYRSRRWAVAKSIGKMEERAHRVKADSNRFPILTDKCQITFCFLFPRKYLKNQPLCFLLPPTLRRPNVRRWGGDSAQYSRRQSPSSYFFSRIGIGSRIINCVMDRNKKGVSFRSPNQGGGYTLWKLHSITSDCSDKGKS